jgi:DNA adenine methylase
VKISDKDAEMLLSANPHAPTFIQDTFQGLYYTDEENRFLDQVRANIDRLEDPYKRSLALAALVRACLKRRPRGIFAYVGERYNDNRPDMQKNLREHFAIALQEFNHAVFDNLRSNMAFNCDVFDLDVTADLVYIDPPYYSPLADSDYVRRYHFIEGLVRYWNGVEIQTHTKTKKFKKYPTAFDGRDSTYEAFPKLFEKFQRSILVVSYSSNSLPSKSELAAMLKQFKRKVSVFQIGHRYSFGTQRQDVEANDAEEYVFVGN